MVNSMFETLVDNFLKMFNLKFFIIMFCVFIAICVIWRKICKKIAKKTHSQDLTNKSIAIDYFLDSVKGKIQSIFIILYLGGMPLTLLILGGIVYTVNPNAQWLVWFLSSILVVIIIIKYLKSSIKTLIEIMRGNYVIILDTVKGKKAEKHAGYRRFILFILFILL